MSSSPIFSSVGAVRSAPWLAGVAALSVFIAKADGDIGGGEAGAFVAAAREFSVPHAPGAPLSTLLMGLSALVPLGPLAFRVSAMSALCGGIAIGLFCHALYLTLRQLIAASETLCAALALGGALLFAGTPLVLAGATRPAVFALQSMLTLIVMGALVHYETDEPHGTTRTLYFAAFVHGLCFANHHVYGLLLLPVAAPTLGRLFAQRGFIGLMGHVAAPLLGFSAYIYVPLRLGSAPFGFGEEGGLLRVLSMLSTEPYWGPSYLSPADPFRTLLLGLESSSAAVLWPASALVVLGLWKGLSSTRRRRFGLLWFLALVVPFTSVALVLKPKLEVDVWGALFPSAAALTVFLMIGVATLLSAAAKFKQKKASTLLALLFCSLTLLALIRPECAQKTAERRLFARVAALTYRALPSRAVVFSDLASHAFFVRGYEAEEELRPDLTLVPLAFRSLPGAVDSWVAKVPALKDSLRDFLLTGQLTRGSLQSLAAQKPVYLEPCPLLPLALYESLLDERLFVRVLSAKARQDDLSLAKSTQDAVLSRLYDGNLLPGVDRELMQRLGRAHFYQALVRVSLHDSAGARRYLDYARASGLPDSRIVALLEALGRGDTIHLDQYLEASRPAE